MNRSVSVVIPVYNAASTLERCVQSVLNQGVEDLEVLLINDGSTDQSGVLCNALYQRYPEAIIYISVPNGGVSKARNLGILQASKKYVVFVDSDDYLLDNYLTSFLNTLELKPEALIYQGFHSEYENRLVVEGFNSACYQNSDIIEGLIYLEKLDYLGTIWNKIFLRSVLIKQDIFFNERISLGEDKLFTLTYLKYVKELVILPDTNYIYNRNMVGSLTKKTHLIAPLLEYVESEREGLMQIMEKWEKSSSDFLQVINSRYLSFCKYILYMMHRNGTVRSERKKFAKKIYQFSKVNPYIPSLDRHTNILIRKYYRFDTLIHSLVFLKKKLE